MNKNQNLQYDDLINGNLHQMKQGLTIWAENMGKQEEKNIRWIQYCNKVFFEGAPPVNG